MNYSYIFASMIEKYNKAVTIRSTVGSWQSSFNINWELIARIKEYRSVHGYPTEQDYINHTKNLKIKKK